MICKYFISYFSSCLFRFLEDPQRMNVALTRAKQSIIVLVHSDSLQVHVLRCHGLFSYSEKSQNRTIFCYILWHFRICTMVIEALTPLYRTSRIKMYKNNARSRLFFRIAKRLLLLKACFTLESKIAREMYSKYDRKVLRNYFCHCFEFFNQQLRHHLDTIKSSV